MTPSIIAYFGYGSLVNLGSLRTPYIDAHRATIKGWRRCWLAKPPVAGHSNDDDHIAFLSVVADASTEIDGLLITDHKSSLGALDEREAMYSRSNIPTETLRLHDDAPEVSDSFLYIADQPKATNQSYILRSYLDVVMQGYLQQFGEDGLHRFIDTTMNFNIPIKEDRENPLYPRATELSGEEIRLFSGLL